MVRMGIGNSVLQDQLICHTPKRMSFIKEAACCLLLDVPAGEDVLLKYYYVFLVPGKGQKPCCNRLGPDVQYYYLDLWSCLAQ